MRRRKSAFARSFVRVLGATLFERDVKFSFQKISCWERENCLERWKTVKDSRVFRGGESDREIRRICRARTLPPENLRVEDEDEEAMRNTENANVKISRVFAHRQRKIV